MRLKQRVGDFRVRELLRRDFLVPEGEHRVYRVTKRKLTSDEALRALATEAAVDPGEVQVAGLKDRQGLTIQYMSVARGREVHLATSELKIEPAGFALAPLTSGDSLGNAFELTVRMLGRDDLQRLRVNLPLMRAHGVPNYFDDQRFGNLTHDQGWIYKGLCLGDTEGALRRLLGAPSHRDDERHRRFKQGLARHVHPHMLRHSFASHVLQSSGDLRAVQEMLGHASIASTQVYTHLDFQALAKVYDAAHPRARRKKAK